jgi:hypothetical protein
LLITGCVVWALAVTKRRRALGHFLRVLQLAHRQDPLTELVAKKIIEAADLGERDPKRLCNKALTELGINPEKSS